MDSHATEYYSPYSDITPHGKFHRVIALHEQPAFEWSEISQMAPTLAKGWFELAHLSVRDRIDFTHEYWLAKLPYHPSLQGALHNFFSSLDDIAVFLTQQNNGEPFQPQLIYSLADNSGFFHGNAAAIDENIINLQKEFPEYILPEDYLAFLKIHNGFSKLTDTGVMKSTEMKTNYINFQEMLAQHEQIVTSQGVGVNPFSLIPFYKSFGMPFFQCFWGEWYPESEMGNVYYSGVARTISDCTKADCHIEAMAFESFTDWLIFYLEKIE